MASCMAPPPQPLADDLIPGILLRIPPDDPAGLLRASAVCKDWRRIITDAVFPGRYRALHPTAPVLDFLHNPRNRELPRFVSTTSFRPSDADHRRCHVLDCRHGRAVFFDYGSLQSYVVWDPVTGERHKIPDVPDVLTRPAVVCAAGGSGCDDHRGCSGKPFVVAFVGVENLPESHYFDAHACFYASDTGEWSVHINIHIDHGRYNPDDRPAALVGDSLYFFCGRGILRYRYGLLRRVGGRDFISAGFRERDVLSMMQLPSGEGKRLCIGKNTDVVVMEAEGWDWPACVLRLVPCSTCWQWRQKAPSETMPPPTTTADGCSVARVIDLRTLLPVGSDPKWKPCLRL